MLSFAYKRFGGRVPEPGNPSRPLAKGLNTEDRALLEQVEAGFETVAICTTPASSARRWARRWP
jgi:hypothetical protein